MAFHVALDGFYYLGRARAQVWARLGDIMPQNAAIMLFPDAFALLTANSNYYGKYVCTEQTCVIQ